MTPAGHLFFANFEVHYKSVVSDHFTSNDERTIIPVLGILLTGDLIVAVIEIRRLVNAVQRRGQLAGEGAAGKGYSYVFPIYLCIEPHRRHGFCSHRIWL